MWSQRPPSYLTSSDTEMLWKHFRIWYLFQILLEGHHTSRALWSQFLQPSWAQSFESVGNEMDSSDVTSASGRGSRCPKAHSCIISIWFAADFPRPPLLSYNTSFKPGIYQRHLGNLFGISGVLIILAESFKNSLTFLLSPVSSQVAACCCVLVIELSAFISESEYLLLMW